MTIKINPIQPPSLILNQSKQVDAQKTYKKDKNFKEILQKIQRRRNSRMEEKTYEYCPWRKNEVEISADTPEPCPICGHILNPCSTCYDHLDGYKECDWTEEKGCWRFPKN